jgi:hypothetical protein
MQIRCTFERSGGFANVPLRIQFDTNNMPVDQAGTLRTLIDNADFFNLPRRTIGPGADRYQYTINVEAGGRRHTVTLSEGAVPDALRPLIDFLLAETRGRE